MKKTNILGSLLVAVLLAALFFLLPTSAQAATPDELEYYVDIDTFTAYMQEVFFGGNEDTEIWVSFIDLSQYNLPSTEALKMDVLRHALQAVPELAALSGYQLEAGTTSGTPIAGIRIVWNMSAYKNNSYFYAMQRAAAPLLEGVVGNDALSEAEKALILHDRLALWTFYDMENYLNDTIPGVSYTAYGALVNRTTVCQGYAQAYSYLLAHVGIYSKITSSGLLDHAWNIVYIDGVAYHVDVTWDDPDEGSQVEHHNFLRSTDGIFSTGHGGTNVSTGEKYIDYDDTPQDTRYDRAYWSGVESPILLVDGDFYYLSGDYIYRRDGDTSVAIDYAGWYAQLNSVGDKLLIGYQQSVALLDPKTLEEELIASVSAPSKDHIIEGFVYEKSHVVFYFTKGYYSEGNFERVEVQSFYVLPGENGWRQDPYGAIYLDSNGLLVRNTWMEDAKGWRYLGADGYVAYEIWQDKGTERYYLDETGYIATEQWAWDSTGWRWLDQDGHFITGCWHWDKYGLYYIDDNGFRVKNTWLHDGIGWRYLNGNGRAYFDTWYIDGSKYYFFDPDGYRVTGWHQFGDHWSWFDANGVEARSTWFQDESNRWCYATSIGYVIKSGWIRYDGTSYLPNTSAPNPYSDSSPYQYYYIGSDYYMVRGWSKIDGTWYFFADSGIMRSNTWIKDSAGWCYLGKHGGMLKDIWIYDNGQTLTLGSYNTADISGGKLYYIDANGYMTVGWKYINQMWYWFDSSGVKAKNRWVKDSAGWCYSGSAGNTLIHCWVEDSTGKCYVDDNGRMLTSSWVFYQNSWYYVDAGGHQVANGWQLVNGKWYYFNSFGVMLKNCWLFEMETGLQAISGYTKSNRTKYTTYYLTSSGAMATGWTKIDNNWFWFNSSGVMLKNDWMLDSVGWCRLGADGMMLTNCWQKDSSGICYIGNDGYILKNTWLQLSGQWYYLDANGYRASGWHLIGGNWYYFYSGGMMAKNTSMDGGWINADGVWKSY